MARTERAADILVSALGEQDSAVREALVAALADCGVPAVRPLCAASRAPYDPRTRSAALKALGRARDSAVLALLIESVDDPDASVQAAATASLARWHDPQAVDAFIRGALRNRHEGWKGWCTILASIPDHTLWEVWGRYEEVVRKVCTKFIGRTSAYYDRAEVVREIEATTIRRLETGHPELGRSLLGVLGDIGFLPSLVPLMAGLASPDESVQTAAKEALHKLHARLQGKPLCPFCGSTSFREGDRSGWQCLGCWARKSTRRAPEWGQDQLSLALRVILQGGNAKLFDHPHAATRNGAALFSAWVRSWKAGAREGFSCFS